MTSENQSGLLALLSEVCRQGPIDAVSKGSNSVGKTLQIALGMQHKTDSRNSLNGFTVTATKSRRNSASRTNLFACVPDWKSSPLKSSNEILTCCGRPASDGKHDITMFCTISCAAPNNFGLQLRLNGEYLEEHLTNSMGTSLIVRWQISKLVKRFLERSGCVAIVSGLPVERRGRPAFHYRYAELFSDADPTMFKTLLSNGSITVDHLISRARGAEKAREKGPLFKIRSDARRLLYRQTSFVDLSEYAHS